VPPHPPVADIGGPYVCTAGIPCRLDASGSFDIDPTDFISEYGWELDGSGVPDFDEAFGPTVDRIFPTPGPVNVGVRVKDNGVLNDLDNDGEVDENEKLSDQQFTSVSVVENQPPVANAGGPYAIFEGSSVQLDATGSTDPNGNPLSYAWDLDNDGEFDDAFVPRPSISFQDNGSYPVAVRVSDSLLSSTASATVSVSNVAPSVEAGPNQTKNKGETVSFSGSFEDPGTLDTHVIEWDFGDGTTASGTLTPSHVYPAPGAYTVTLTVTDDDGGVGTDSLVVTVLNQAPVADAGGPYTVAEGSTTTVDGSASTDPDGDPLSYAWDLDNDGEFDDAFTPTAPVSFGDNGSYPVALRVSDSDLSSTDGAVVTVTNVAPTVDAGADQSANTGETVSFSGSFTDPGTLDTQTIEWDFGDGGTSTSTLTPTHVYGAPGNYTVTLRVTDDDGGVGVDSLVVAVSQDNRPPVADAGGPYTASEGSMVTVDGAASTDPDGNPLSYAWDLDNDGEFDDAFTPTASVSFAENGSYPVALRVSDSVLSSTDGAVVTVTNVAPSVDAGADQSANTGDTVSFSGSFSDPGTLDTHVVEWDFGDGSFASGTLTPAHVYTAAGTYTVTLRVTDDDGGEGIDSLVVTVAAPAAPIQDLQARAKDAKIDLLWTPVPGAVAYNVYRRAGAQGSFVLIAEGHVTDFAVYADFGLTNGTTYYYFVRWLNASGIESPDSNIASATPNRRR
jgi:PKD repeat protein